MDFLRALFSSDEYLPHSFCYLSQPSLVRLHLLTDLGIGVSYVAIALTLAYLVYKARRDIPFHWMFMAFGLFIITCGFTHFMEVVTLWNPLYWLAGGLKLVTALASVVTAVLLPPLVPKTRGLIHSAQISEQRKLDLETAHDELESLYTQLKELDMLKTQFFANVSHELRTPLTLILGPAEKMLATQDVAPDLRRQLEIIQRNAHTLLKHVNDLLDLAKLDAQKMAAHYSRQDFARLVRMVAANFEGVVRDREIDFAVEGDESVVAVIDAEKLQRVVLNLLSNAFKFTPVGGRIRVRTGSEDRHLVLAVRDSGPGIREEMRATIFERFRQAEGGDTRRFGGTGLGLAIAREFVLLHHGTITVDEAPEGGAMFVVRIPIAGGAGASAAAGIETETAPVSTTPLPYIETPASGISRPLEATLAPGATEDGSPDERPTVLVVEDNPEMNAFIEESLSGDYHVECAFDGHEGVAKALKLRPDLIITDIMMPRLSGGQLVASVRQQLENVPIIVLSAKGDEQARIDLLQRGADDYVLKPFSLAELTIRVDNAVRLKRIRDLLQRELASKQRDVFTLARELSSRRRDLEAAMEKLAASEQTLKRFVEANIIGVVFATTDGRITEANEAFLRMVQYTRQDIVEGNLRWTEITPPEFAVLDQKCVEQAKAGNRTCSPYEKEYIRRDGSRVPVLIGAAWLSEPAGNCVAFALDLTELKKAERVRHEFLAILSHELRTPLTSIVGWIRLMRTGRLDSNKMQTAIETIDRNAELQARLVEDVIDMSRMITGQLQMEFGEVNLNGIIHNVMLSAQPEAEKKGVAITHDAAKLPVIIGHGVRLQQVILNLVFNAVKFTPAGGRVHIQARVADDAVEIQIADTGVGISSEFLPHVFQPFRQQDASTTRRHGGLGLGLAIAQNLVQLHGGTISAESGGLNQGSTFVVTLPVVHPDPLNRFGRGAA